jgi:hypothetical protein
LRYGSQWRTHIQRNSLIYNILKEQCSTLLPHTFFPTQHTHFILNLTINSAFSPKKTALMFLRFLQFQLYIFRFPRQTLSLLVLLINWKGLLWFLLKLQARMRLVRLVVKNRNSCWNNGRSVERSIGKLNKNLAETFLLTFSICWWSSLRSRKSWRLLSQRLFNNIIWV